MIILGIFYIVMAIASITASFTQDYGFKNRDLYPKALNYWFWSNAAIFIIANVEFLDFEV
jgi:hypothetical protein